MSGIFILGFLLGIRHAMETDHVAAVATLATRSTSLRHTVKLGAIWGLGHSLALLLFGSAILLLDTVVPNQLARALECAVGLMLIVLGIDVLRRLYRERIHFHVHRHPDGEVHFHAHSHTGEKNHNPARHVHAHPEGFPLRALLVGLMHGMAGSAALILLTLQTVDSPLQGFYYIAMFGIGSILGMALLSSVIAIPLRHSPKQITWLHQAIHGALGIATLILGFVVVYQVGISGTI